MTPAPAVPMTAGEAAEKYAAHIGMPVLPVHTDWFAAHWPQPVSGQLTGEALRDAYLSEYRKEFSSSLLTVVPWPNDDPRMVSVWSRAAARLAAPQGVGTHHPLSFKPTGRTAGGMLVMTCEDVPKHMVVVYDAEDAEALKAAPQGVALTHDRAIAAAYRHVVDMIDAMMDKEPGKALRNLRHYFDLLADTHRDAPAAPQGVGFDVVSKEVHDVTADYAVALQRLIEHHCKGLPIPDDVLEQTNHHAAMLARHTPSVAAGREVVEVTASTLAGAHGRASMTDRPGSHWDRMAAEVNTALRARAGTVGPQWITRPAPQAGKLVVPEDGYYVSREAETEKLLDFNWWGRKGDKVPSSYCAIRRIDTDALTTWIDRTATAGGWTARDVEACVGQRVAVLCDNGVETIVKFNPASTAEEIANRMNGLRGHGVTAYLILPPTEAHS